MFKRDKVKFTDSSFDGEKKWSHRVKNIRQDGV